MLSCDMALRAKSRIRYFEKSIVYGPVRFVTICTTFYCGWVFPKERAASFGVARITIFIDTVLLQLSWIGASVWVVAVSASNPSLSDWHVRRA